MQSACAGLHAPPATIVMLPLIDMKPTDESCISTRNNCRLNADACARSCDNKDSKQFWKNVSKVANKKVTSHVNKIGREFNITLPYEASSGKSSKCSSNTSKSKIRQLAKLASLEAKKKFAHMELN